MGSYIDVPGLPVAERSEARRTWLVMHGTMLAEAPKWDEIPHGMMAVCLVDNGAYMAAGICYDSVELTRFTHGMHGRPHWWYLVPHDLLLPVSDLAIWEGDRR